MRRLRTALLLALLGFGLVAALLPTGAVERLELLTLDARYVLGLGRKAPGDDIVVARSEEHTSELQSQSNLVCRLLLEKKKTEPQRVGSITHLSSYQPNESRDNSAHCVY